MQKFKNSDVIFDATSKMPLTNLNNSQKTKKVCYIIDNH